MHIHYTLQKHEAQQHQNEFIHQLLPLSKVRPISAVAAFLLSLTWSYFNHPSSENSTTADVIVALCFQIPAVTVFAYIFLFFTRRNIAKGYAKKQLDAKPPEHWGERNLSIKNSEVELTSPTSTLQFPASRITKISETNSAYFLHENETPLVILPRAICTANELKNAIKINSTQ